ncbi:carbohydrate esterase, partial [Streptomyces swartbergensis]
MRRFNMAVLAAVTLSTALSAVPAHAGEASVRPGLANCTAGACHFDVPPGTYDVRVVLGGKTASATSVSGETRRSLLPETAAPAGERVTRSFTVN